MKVPPIHKKRAKEFEKAYYIALKKEEHSARATYQISPDRRLKRNLNIINIVKNKKSIRDLPWHKKEIIREAIYKGRYQVRYIKEGTTLAYMKEDKILKEYTEPTEMSEFYRLITNSRRNNEAFFEKIIE